MKNLIASIVLGFGLVAGVSAVQAEPVEYCMGFDQNCWSSIK